jgi:hypothetical protein
MAAADAVVQPLAEAFLYQSPEAMTPDNWQWARPLALEHRDVHD